MILNREDDSLYREFTFTQYLEKDSRPKIEQYVLKWDRTESYSAAKAQDGRRPALSQTSFQMLTESSVLSR